MASINETIVAYLERYGQPQTFDAIRSYLNERDFVADDLRERLDALVDSGEVQAVDGGVNEKGDQLTIYAPAAFVG